MRLTSTRTLAVEVAGTRLVVVEADPTTDPPTIHCAVAADATASGLGNTLQALLREHRVRARNAHLVLSEASATHRVMLVPPMSARDRSLFLDRELARELRTKAVVGHTVLQRVDGPPPKDEVLVVAIPDGETRAALAGLLAARLAPRVVTTGALALASAAVFLSPWAAAQPTAVAHWGFRGLTVVVVDNGALRFTREVDAVPGLDPREWFVTEVQRSLRQYMQTVKGSMVTAVLVGSVDADFETALPDVAARLGLPFVNLNDAVRALVFDDEHDAEGAARSPGMFLLPLGAAMLSPEETTNLLPPSIKARRRRALLVRGATAAAALLILGLGYASWSASRELASYRRAAAQVAAQRQAREAEVAWREHVKQERARQYQRIAWLKSDPLGDPPLADVFKEISRVAPDGLHLERLLLGRDAATMTLRLAGQIESADLARAQSEFNRFYFGLERSPLVTGVILNPPAASKITIQQGPSPAVEGRTARDFRRHDADEERQGFGGKGKRLAFELELRLKGVK